MLLKRPVLLAVLGLLALSLFARPAAAEPPAGLPRYHLDVHLDVEQHIALVHERVTWTNRCERPATELVFNAHSHFKLPDGDVGMTAKILEILRVMPSDALDTEGRRCEVRSVVYHGSDAGVTRVGARETTNEPDQLPPPRELPPEPPREIKFSYQEKNQTALEIPLPRPVQKGESVTVDIEFTMSLPQKMGRWGQWKGVTFLSNWLPVLAVYDEKGWQPTPFIPWHQPFFNEAGHFTARIVMPSDQLLACSASVQSEQDQGGGWKVVETAPFLGRDFAILCSNRYREYIGHVGNVKVRCVAFPEHEFYARKMLDSAQKAIEAYSRWFGPFPYPQFTIVESYFGWLGNECAGLIMIDERLFDAPHLAANLVDGLVCHETCHQWWYNVVGTNGYCETWMDEGLATYFSYRLVYEHGGKNENLVQYPRLLEWMPNVRRDDYRYFGLYGTIGRGEQCPTVQPLEKFGHLVNLMSMTYDKGGKIVGMIEERLGEAAFLDFMRRVYTRYQFRILRVADFQHELEEYTGQSWDGFFHDWLYGAGLTDWCVEKVKITPKDAGWRTHLHCIAKRKLGCWGCGPREVIPCKVTVILHQKAEINEQTVLGFSYDGGESYQVRIPIMPQCPVLELEECSARIEMQPKNRVRVDIELPDVPTQIAVDPDQVLVDKNPINNFWKPRLRARVTPLYTMLDETDLTNMYDRWNINIGPWFFTPTYDNPWFTRATRVGVRAGLYRTQDFEGGAYAAYRTDYRDIVAGVDGLWDHVPFDHTQIGFVFERRLAGFVRGETEGNQGVLFGRYIIDYGDSLYLPPFHYIEAFSTIQSDLLPDAREVVPGAERFRHQATAGLHYHLNYLTPYWDAEGGFSCDLAYNGGVTVPGEPDTTHGSHQVQGQFTYVEMLPDWTGRWLSQTKVAARVCGFFGVPDNIQYYALGGGELFRGFDLAQRQGNALWVTNLEWRIPLARNLTWDCFDHAIGLRNINTAIFYDVGDIYQNGHSVNGIAHAVGAGLRLDVSWFSLIERSILRFDAAKCVNDNTPFQFWFGVEHPF
jgi:hypothetical protein